MENGTSHRKIDMSLSGFKKRPRSNVGTFLLMSHGRGRVPTEDDPNSVNSQSRQSSKSVLAGPGERD